MGIRFACHLCGKKLNIKRELAGKRGVCPTCDSRFRIPYEDAETSLPVEAPQTPPPSTAAIADAGSVPSSDAGAESPSQLSVAANDAKEAVSASTPPESFVREGNDSQGDATAVNLYDGNSTWYVRPPSGGQYGPATEEVFRQWVSEGRVVASTLLWRDGWPQWREAIEVLPQFGNQFANQLATQAEGEPMASTVDADQASTIRPAGVYGDAGIGSRRRARSFRRLASITLLSLLAISLIVVLVFVMKSST